MAEFTATCNGVPYNILRKQQGNLMGSGVFWSPVSIVNVVQQFSI